MHPGPLALFLTWTTYGDHLPGDARGWSRHGRRGLPGHAGKEQFAREQMLEPACVLTPPQRDSVRDTIARHCEIRGWPLQAVAVRMNHVHAVVSAPGTEPAEVRRQLKAWTTRRLKQVDPGRTRWWTEGGDIEFLDTEADVAGAVEYVLIAQDRKGRDA